MDIQATRVVRLLLVLGAASTAGAVPFLERLLAGETTGEGQVESEGDGKS